MLVLQELVGFAFFLFETVLEGFVSKTQRKSSGTPISVRVVSRAVVTIRSK